MSFERKGDKKSIKSSKGQFLSGVAVLTLSTLIVKVIGVLYKIPMMQALGETGMGYFNAAYEIYTFFYILATAGLPVAVSILVAERAERGDLKGAGKVYRASMCVFVLLGLIGTAVLFFGAEYFGVFIENSGAVMSIAAIAPMAFFICVGSAVRGYFQGRRNMVPTAVSQVIEAAGKLFLGLALGVFAVNMGYDIAVAAALATLGMTAGAGLSMLYLLLSKLISSGKERQTETKVVALNKWGSVAGRLLKIALPITVSSLVMSLTRVVDLVMILRRLQSIGYTEAAANAIYGSYTTLAFSMFNLPASFVTPIALALLPVLTAAVHRGDREREMNTLNSSLRLCGLITIPASLGLSLFSRPLLELVFGGQQNAINTAAPLLSVLALSLFFSSVMTVTNAVLQSYGKERKPIVSMLLGALVKIVLSYILIGIPKINIYGAPISTFFCTVTVCGMNFRYIKKCTGDMKGAFELFSPSLLSSVISVGLGGGAYLLGVKTVGASHLLTLFAIALTVMIYAVSALKLGAVGEDDLRLLPKGEGICRALKKIRLVN